MRLTLIGHMTVWIELDGVGLLTDPWFGPHGWLEERLAPRVVPPALEPDEIVNRVETRAEDRSLHAFLISHNHLDHVDDAALALARRLGCTVIGSKNAARRAHKAGVASVVALARGEEARLGSLRIRAVRADHPLAADAIGFVVCGTQTCYFSGDSRFTPDLEADLAPFALDVALLQAACAHYPLLGDDGMSLIEAAALARALRPRWTMPLHLHCAGKWLDRAAGQRIEMDNAGAVETAARAWAAGLQREGVGARVLVPGETWEVKGGNHA